jgi:hypothetical protein
MIGITVAALLYVSPTSGFHHLAEDESRNTTMSVSEGHANAWAREL